MKTALAIIVGWFVGIFTAAIAMGLMAGEVVKNFAGEPSFIEGRTV